MCTFDGLVVSTVDEALSAHQRVTMLYIGAVCFGIL